MYSNYSCPSNQGAKSALRQCFSRESPLFIMASFRNIYTSLMLVIARSTEKELARQISYLKAENQILRSRLPDKISLTEREMNRLVRFAKKLGSALNLFSHNSAKNTTTIRPVTANRLCLRMASRSRPLVAPSNCCPVKESR